MNSSSERYVLFIESIKIGNMKKAKSNFIIEYFNEEDKHGLKPIHWACLSSNMEILKWMLEERCDIETSSRNGWRPIHFASFVRNEEMMQFLIEKFCNLNCETDNKETALDVAKGDCNHEFIDEILNENINLKIGLSMGLKCGDCCNHKLCLRSMIQSKFGKNFAIKEESLERITNFKDSNNSQEFAGKILRQSSYDVYPNENCILPNINQILQSSTHPKIVKWFGIIKSETNIILFMEWMNNGKLCNNIKPNEGFDPDTISRYCKDILQAVAYLHDHKILHRFIHPNNIFIDNNGGCKLAIANYSYSLADGDVQIDDEWLKKYSRFSFGAPELANKGRLSYPYDIYWVGITVITMLTGKYQNYKLNGCDELEISISKINNEVLKSFIKSMVMENPNERATANDLLNSNFIRNISNDISVDNSNDNLSTRDNSLIKCDNVINVINNAINNMKIGLLWELECNEDCNHNFCLSSVTATNFKEGKYIGGGAFGEVYKLEFKPGIYWAVKIIKNVDNENIKEEAKYFENDINKYRESINHDNIVKYFGAVRNLKKIFILMEFIDGESLYQKIKKNKYKPLPLRTIKQHTKQILEGLNFLHKKEIMHRDIKSENILIDENNIVKIVDFGMRRFLRTISKYQKKTKCGTSNYMSPEMIRREAYTCSTDIWSLGATVFEMATGYPPYHGIDETVVINKIGSTMGIEYPSNMQNYIKDFLNLMLVADPKIRSSAESLLSCEFLKYRGI